MTRTILAMMSAALALTAAAPAQAEWIASWTAAPVTPTVAANGPLPASPSYANRTIRQTLRLSAGGKAVRISLSNAYGKAPLKIGGARIAILDKAGKEVAGTSRTLRFGGQPTAVIAQGAPLVSDAADLVVPHLARVALSVYFPEETGPCTCHTTGLDQTEISAPGDFTASPFEPESKMEMRAFLGGVYVDAPAGSATVAILGDSISDGVGSTSGANLRWPDQLADRLVARKGRVWGVANQGISGNRILHDGWGTNALARLDRDILALPGLKAMIVFEGVNDLGIAFAEETEGPLKAMRAALGGGAITPEQVIEGYKQIIARAHAKGVKVYGATIAPYKGAAYWSPKGEAARQKINAFIRTGGAFDAVLDFDKAFADPADPASMRPGYHMGDHLHGTDAGYKAVAESIDLTLFGDK